MRIKALSASIPAKVVQGFVIGAIFYSYDTGEAMFWPLPGVPHTLRRSFELPGHGVVLDGSTLTLVSVKDGVMGAKQVYWELEENID